MPPSNVSTEAISGVQSLPKYIAPEYNKNERNYTERYSSRVSQGSNLKLIIIPIIAVSIIGSIVSVSYFKTPSYPGIELANSTNTTNTVQTPKLVTPVPSDNTRQATIENQTVNSDTNSQNQPAYPINTLYSASIPFLSLENLNILDQNQLIAEISSKISRLRTFDQNKITQALLEITQNTAAKDGDVMKNLREIGTTILQNPSDPLIDRIIGLAQTK